MKSHHLRVHKGAGRAEFRPEQNLLLIQDASGNEESLTISYTDSRALELLLSVPGQIRSREEILRYAWEHRIVSTGSLNQCIFNLRNLIGDEKLHEIIQTVPRRGYRWNPDFALTEPSAPATPLPAAPPLLTTPICEADADADAVVRPTVSAGQGAGLLWVWNASLGLVLLMFWLWQQYDYANYTPSLLAGPVALDTREHLGYRFNIVRNGNPVDELLEAIVAPAFAEASADYWVVPRSNDFSLSCVPANGTAVNAIIPKGRGLAPAVSAFLRRCSA